MRKHHTRHVCMVTSSYAPSIDSLVRRLNSLQYNDGTLKYAIHVIYIDFPGLSFTGPPSWGYPINYPYKTHSLATMGIVESFMRIPLFIRMAKSIRHIIKEYNAEIIHAHWAIPAGFLSCLLSRKIPVILTIRGSDINKLEKQSVFKYPVKYALQHSSRIIAISHDLKKQAIKLGALEENIKVIPTGVDINKFKPMNKQRIRSQLGLTEDPIVLFAGNLIQLKGVDKLIRASSRVTQQFAHKLLILGDGPELKRLKVLSDNLGVRNIDFKGRIPHTDMPMYMAASDIFVLPSESEGLGDVVQEALACGTPAIASNVGGLPDLILDGFNGYLINNEDELEERMIHMLACLEKRVIMGNNAIEFTNQYLTHDATVHETDQVYEELLSMPADRRP